MIDTLILFYLLASFYVLAACFLSVAFVAGGMKIAQLWKNHRAR